MTNTNKMNKEQMVAFLDEHFKEVKDKSLKDRITYTANAWKKDAKSVGITDLRSLVKEVLSVLTPAEATPAPANSVKKTLKKKTAEPKEETPAEEKSEKKPAKKKAPAKKAPEKKSAVKKSDAKGRAFDIADVFADSFEVQFGTLEKAQDIKDFKDLAEALKNEEEIYFAFYWTSRLLRQFDYCPIKTVKKPKEFDNDLDLVSCIYLSDEGTLAIGVSSYTDAPYIIAPEDMKVTEDGFRYSNQMEFEVYRLVGEVE